MSSGESTAQYYARRATMERAAADVARDDTTRDIHRTLAEHYDARSVDNGATLGEPLPYRQARSCDGLPTQRGLTA